MAPRKQSRGASSKSAATTPVPKKRVATNGFKLPDPIPAGQVITDIAKNVWVLGKSIGQGGFGEIYLASADPTRPVCDTDKYVVKVEPHSNGPLFTEMHCYMRIAKPDLIEAWMKEHKYKRFGMPKYLGSGSFVYMSQKYRFMVMERFGSDLQKILEQHNKKFSFKTVYQVGLEIIDVLEYIHDKGYIHADIKASNLLVGFQRGTQDQVFLVDYGLACRYAVDGVHKEYKYDGRKAHDGTIEFTSRDAHIGAHSRRGDLEILGYNLCQWLCSRLPWEDNLTDCDLVAKHKRYYMDNVDKLMDKCFPDDAPIPPGLQEFLTYVASLTFDEKPDYEKCRNILRDGLVERDYKDDGKLVFMSATPKPISKKPKSRIKKKGLKRRRSDEEENMGSIGLDEDILGLSPRKVIRTSPRSPCKSTSNRINTRLCPRKSYIAISLSTVALPLMHSCVDPEDVIIEKENEKMLERQRQQRPKRALTIKKDTSLDNPTPAMMVLMAKRREKSLSPPVCVKKHKHRLNCVMSNISSSGKCSPTFEELPTNLTPEMEAVIRRRTERDAIDAVAQQEDDDEEEDYDSNDSSTSSIISTNRFFPSHRVASLHVSPPSPPSPPAIASGPPNNNALKIGVKSRTKISRREIADLLDVATRAVSYCNTSASSGSQRVFPAPSAHYIPTTSNSSHDSSTTVPSDSLKKAVYSPPPNGTREDDPYEFIDEIDDTIIVSPISYKVFAIQNSPVKPRVTNFTMSAVSLPCKRSLAPIKKSSNLVKKLKSKLKRPLRKSARISSNQCQITEDTFA